MLRPTDHRPCRLRHLPSFRRTSLFVLGTTTTTLCFASGRIQPLPLLPLLRHFVFHPPTRLSRGSGFSLRGRPGNLPQRPRRPFAVNTFIQLDSLDCPWWCPKVGTLCVIGIDVSLSPRGGAPRDALASPFAFISRSRAGPSLLCSASCCRLTSPLVTVNTAAGYACYP